MAAVRDVLDSGWLNACCLLAVAVATAVWLYPRSLCVSKSTAILPIWVTLEVAVTAALLHSNSVFSRVPFIFRWRKGSLFGLTSRHQILYSVSSIEQVFAKGHHLDTSSVALGLVLRGFGVLVSPTLRANFSAFTKAVAVVLERGFVNDAVATTTILRGDIPQKVSALLSFSEEPLIQRRWERSAGVKVIVPPCGIQPGAVEVDIEPLLRDLGACIAIPLLYGQDFLDRNPSLLDDFWGFDNHAFPLLVVGAPAWTPVKSFQDGLAARVRLHSALTAFYSRLDQYQKDEAVDFDADMSDVNVVALERNKIFQDYGVPLPDRGKYELSILWAQNANTHRIIFWFILYIYSTPGLLDSLREEIKAYVSLSSASELSVTALDLPALCRNCPLLRSSLFETFRMVNEPTSIRYLSQPVIVVDGDHHHNLSPGSWISAPHAGVHHNPSVFHDPQNFIPDRFIDIDKQTGEKMVRYRSLKPWGAGFGICKGRGFAEKQILAVACCFIALWDMEPCGGGSWKLPGILPGTGVMRPQEAVRVVVKRRCLNSELD